MIANCPKAHLKGGGRTEQFTVLLQVIGVPRSMFLQYPNRDSTRNTKLQRPFWRRSDGHILDVLNEAKRIYRQRSRMEHPDKGGDSKQYAELTVAYRRLKVLARKHNYEI